MKPNCKPHLSLRNVYSVWPNGDDERFFDVHVWALPKGKRYIEVELVSGLPLPDGFQTEGFLVADDQPSFFYYITLNGKHDSLCCDECRDKRLSVCNC